MNNKKGQAAMEFLMTYGWAILVAIIVIGLLFYYYGVNRFTQTGTSTQAPFYTTGATIAADGTLTIILRNDAGEDVTVTNLETAGGVTDCDALGSNIPIAAGATATVAIDNCKQADGATDLVTGNTAKADLTVSYTKVSATGLTLKSTGSMVEKVQ